MSIEIIRVPLDFKHPIDDRDEIIPGAHHELLYCTDAAAKTGYQLYENVTEGTPQSPIFCDLNELKVWLESQGWAQHKIAFLMEHGHAPSFVL